MPEVEPETQDQGSHQSPCGGSIHDGLFNLEACQPSKEKTEVGVGKPGVPQFTEHAEMPVGQGAVSESVKDPQDNPGAGRKQQADQVDAPGLFPDPAEKVEQHQAGVENGKENIQDPHTSINVQHFYLLFNFGPTKVGGQ